MRKPNIDWDAWLAAAIVITLVLLIAIGCAHLTTFLWAEKHCLMHGWKDAKVTWDLTAYCIREENEYEIVRPLSEVMMAEENELK